MTRALAALCLLLLLAACDAAPAGRALPLATGTPTQARAGAIGGQATATPTARPTATAGPDYAATLAVVQAQAAGATATVQAYRDAVNWADYLTRAATDRDRQRAEVNATAGALTNSTRATAQSANATGTALVFRQYLDQRAIANADGTAAAVQVVDRAAALVQAERERTRDQWAGVAWLAAFVLAGGLASTALAWLAGRAALYLYRLYCEIEADRLAGAIVTGRNASYLVRQGPNGPTARPLPVPSTSRGPTRPAQTPVAPRVAVEDVNGQPAAVLRAAPVSVAVDEGLALLDDCIALREAEGADADWSRLPGSRELVEAGYEWDSVKWGRVTDTFTPWIKKRQGAGTILCRPDYRDLRAFRDAWAAGIVAPGAPTTPPGAEVRTLKVPVASG